MKLPIYQVETPLGQWGFMTLYALNIWIKGTKIDPTTIKVFMTVELAEREWKQDVHDTRTNEAPTL
jgi:hypothetical protein